MTETENIPSTEYFRITTKNTKAEDILWEECLVEIKKGKSWEHINRLEETLITRFIRGSDHISKKQKRIKYIVKTLEDLVDYIEEYDIPNIFSSNLEHLKNFLDSLWPGRIYTKTKGFDMNNLTDFEKKQTNVDYSYKKDRGVIYLDLGFCDFNLAKVFSKKGMEKEFIKHMAYTLELMNLKLKTTWRCNTKMVVIYNLSKLTMKEYYKAYKVGLTKVFQHVNTYYPEFSDKILILNPPRIFSVIFSMLKPFIKPDTITKIRMLHGNKQIQQGLEKEGVDISKLPKDVFEGGCENARYEHILDDASIAFAADLENKDKNLETLTDMLQKNFALDNELN